MSLFFTIGPKSDQISGSYLTPVCLQISLTRWENVNTEMSDVGDTLSPWQHRQQPGFVPLPVTSHPLETTTADVTSGVTWSH